MYSQLADRMVLTDIHDGWSFSLGIKRFEDEHPTKTGKYDVEWLVVSLAVHSPDSEWPWIDPCLLFSEAKRLAAWLAEVASGETTEDKIDFVEPEIAFQAFQDSPEYSRVRLYIWHHSTDSFADAWEETERSYGGIGGFPISARCRDFVVSRPDLLRASDALLENLRKLPQRDGLSV